MEETTKNGSSFIKELEDRLNDIFQEEKQGQAEPPDSQEPVGAAALNSAGLQEEANRGGLLGDLDESNSIMFSHIKDLKSIVLSLEWELSEETLARFDEEVLKIEDAYPEDMFTLAFARILRFLGRYIRVKGTESEPRSINLLLSTYDNLERVLLSRNMSETDKYSLMAENISNYRQWVETEDLEIVNIEGTGGTPEALTEEAPAVQMFAGRQEEEEAQAEGPAPAIAEASPTQLTQREASENEIPQPEISQKASLVEAFLEIEAVAAESSSPLDEIELEGEAAQWKKAVEKDSIAEARSIEEEPLFDRPPYVRDPLDEVRADDVVDKDVIPGKELQAENISPGEVAAVDFRGDSVESIETKISEPSGRDEALALDLERIRQEIRNEIIDELRGEIDALREEIRYLAKKINWGQE